MALSIVIFAESAAAYWFAGILTVAAAGIVTLVMLAAANSDQGESP